MKISSQASRDLVAHFLGAPTFRLVAMLHSSQQIDALIDSREAALVLVIDPRFSRNLQTGQPAPVQAILDGRNSNTALLIEGYANTILSDFSIAWAAAHGGAPPPAVLDIRARYNPTLSSRWFFVPSIVALLTQIVTLLVVAMSVARERETGTFDQLLVTPLRPIDILLGKGLPGVLIGLIEASVIIVAAVWWFEVPLRGGLLPLYLGLLVFVIAVTGMGLMISALAATQQQALLRGVPVHGALDHPVWLRHPDRQHAGVGAGPDPHQPDALFPGHRARRVLGRGEPVLARLAILADGADRSSEPRRRGMAVPQPRDVSRFGLARTQRRSGNVRAEARTTSWSFSPRRESASPPSSRPPRKKRWRLSTPCSAVRRGLRRDAI